MHVDALKPGERVLLIDDLLATGGTSAAAVALVKKLGAQYSRNRFSYRTEIPERPRKAEGPLRALHHCLLSRRWSSSFAPWTAVGNLTAKDRGVVDKTSHRQSPGVFCIPTQLKLELQPAAQLSFQFPAFRYTDSQCTGCKHSIQACSVFVNQSLSNPFFDWLMPVLSGNALFFPAADPARQPDFLWKGGVRMRLCILLLLLILPLGDGFVHQHQSKTSGGPATPVCHPPRGAAVWHGGQRLCPSRRR